MSGDDERLGFVQLKKLDLHKLKSAATAWQSLHDELKKIASGDGKGASAAALRSTAHNADWIGDNAAVTKDFTERTAMRFHRMVEHANSVHEVLETAYEALTGYRGQLDQEIVDAGERGVHVSDSGKIEPAKGANPAEGQLSMVATRLNWILSRAGSAHAECRGELYKLAHDRYDFAKVDHSFGAELLEAAKAKVDPPDGAVERLGWGVDHADTTLSGVAEWNIHVRYGDEGIEPAREGRLQLDADDARNTPDGGSSPSSANAAQRAKFEEIGKWSGRAAGVAGVGVDSWTQWNADSGKGYDTDERVGRAAGRGVTAGGAGWGGGIAGAKLGALAGGAVGGPVGIAVGGVIGGVAGGIAGSAAGNWLADQAMVDIGQKLGDGVGDGLSKLGDGLGQAGDKLKFWD